MRYLLLIATLLWPTLNNAEPFEKVFNTLNGVVVTVSGKLMHRGGRNHSVHFETLNYKSFPVEFALVPKELREFNEKCPRSEGIRSCIIDAEAEIDTSSGELVLWISKLHSIEPVQ